MRISTAIVAAATWMWMPPLQAAQTTSVGASTESIRQGAMALTAMLGLAALLVISRFWTRRVARKIRMRTGLSRALVTARIVKAVGWRYGLVLFMVVPTLLALTEGSPERAGRLFAVGLAFAIIAFPIGLLSVWQVARRISFGVIKAVEPLLPPDPRRDEVTLPEACLYHSGRLLPEFFAEGLRHRRFVPTLMEAVTLLFWATFLVSVSMPIYRRSIADGERTRKSGEVQVTPSSARIGLSPSIFDKDDLVTARSGSEKAAPSLDTSRTLKSAGTFDIKALARQASPSVVLVIGRNTAGKDDSFGTGFVIQASGIKCIATCLHVIKDVQSISIKTLSGETLNSKGVLAYDVAADLAVISVECDSLPALALGESLPLEVGEQIGVVGNPQGLSGTVSEGIVSAKRKEGEEVRYLQITAPISSGSSGSPVLNGAGAVCGVASVTFSEGQALNFAVAVEALKALLERHTTLEVIQAEKPMLFTAVAREVKSANSISGPYGNEVRNELTTLLKKEDYVASSRLIRAWLEDHPDDGLAYGMLGENLVKLKDWKAAILALDRAITTEPDSFRWWTLKGEAHAALKEWQKAVGSYECAAVLKAPDTDAKKACLRHLVDAAVGVDDYSAVINALKRVQGLGAKLTIAEWYLLASAHEHRGEPAETVAVYRKASDAYPDECMVRVELAQLLRKLKRWDESKAVYAEINRRFPNYHAELFRAGRDTLMKSANSKIEWNTIAIKFLEAAAALKPESCEYWFALADAYKKAGREEDAVSARKYGVSKQSGQRPAEDALLKLLVEHPKLKLSKQSAEALREMRLLSPDGQDSLKLILKKVQETRNAALYRLVCDAVAAAEKEAAQHAYGPQR